MPSIPAQSRKERPPPRSSRSSGRPFNAVQPARTRKAARTGRQFFQRHAALQIECARAKPRGKDAQPLAVARGERKGDAQTVRDGIYRRAVQKELAARQPRSDSGEARAILRMDRICFDAARQGFEVLVARNSQYGRAGGQSVRDRAALLALALRYASSWASAGTSGSLPSLSQPR